MEKRLEEDARGKGEEGTANSGGRYGLIYERLGNLYRRYPNYFKTGVLTVGLAGAIGVGYFIGDNNEVSAPNSIEEIVQQPPLPPVSTIVPNNTEEAVEQPPSSPVGREVVENTNPQPPSDLEADEGQPNQGNSVENPIIAPLLQQSPLEVMCPAYNSSPEAGRNNTLRCVNRGLLYLANNGDCENREYFLNLNELIDSLDERTRGIKKKALLSYNAQECGIPSDEIRGLGLGELEQRLNTRYSLNSGS